jgi:nitric oxide dioxygenase
MATLAVVVNGLGNLETIVPAASTLAKRHVNYGVKAADYTCVGDAAVDARTRPWRPMDPATRRRLERGLRDLSDFMIGEAYDRGTAADERTVRTCQQRRPPFNSVFQQH